MTDIDWLRVDMVCNGTSLALTPDEKRMVVRRLDHRMIDQDDPWRAYGSPGKLDGGQVADRLRTTKRSVQRLREELPPATRRTCPVCAEPMWVLQSGVVEPHPDRIFEECPMSGQAAPAAPKGLAAIRPDLYPWLVTA